MYQGYAKNGGLSTIVIENTKLMRISNNKNFKKSVVPCVAANYAQRNVI